MIMIFQRDNKTENYRIDFRRLLTDNVKLEDIEDLLNRKPNSKIEYLSPIIKRKDFDHS